MKQAFVFGLEHTVADSFLRPTQELYGAVGQNTGNLAFQYAVRRIIAQPMRTVGWTAPETEIKSAGDIAVIPCANQLGKHTDLGTLAAGIGRMPCKVVAIGLGAQDNYRFSVPDVPEGTLRWVEAIASRGREGIANIAVRGQFTLRTLAKYGLEDRATILGCPSFLINPDRELGQKIAERHARTGRSPRVGVAAGHQRWSHLARVERSLINIMMRTGGSYFAQSPFELIALTRGDFGALNEDQVEACRSFLRPRDHRDAFLRWVRRFGESYFDASAWMERLLRFDFVVGTRIHGVVLALQAGIPALCIAHDMRTTELCETGRIPYVQAQNLPGKLELNDLDRLFRFEPDKFDEQRGILARATVRFLKQNEIEASCRLKALAAQKRGLGKR